MSTWSDLGLPAFQVSGYGYTIDAQLLRTPFKTRNPNQARKNRLNRKEFSAEVLLTQHQLNIAETFLRASGYGWFTVGLLTGGGEPYRDDMVRLIAAYQVAPVGYNLYRLKISLESRSDGLLTTLARFSDLDEWDFMAYADILPIIFNCNLTPLYYPRLAIDGMACSADGNHVVAGMPSGTAAIMCDNALAANPTWVEIPGAALHHRNPSISDDGNVVFVPGVSGNQRALRRKDGVWYQGGPLNGTSKLGTNWSAMSADGQIIVTGGTTSSATGGIYRSVDYGASFVREYVTTLNFHKAACSADASKILVIQQPSPTTVVLYENSAWSDITGQISGPVYGCGVSRDGSTLVLGGGSIGGGIHVRRNGAWVFQQLYRYNGLVSNSSYYRVALSSDGKKIFVACSAGLWFSQDYGSTFQQCPNTDLRVLSALCCTSDGGIAYEGAFSGDQVISRYV